MLVSFLSWDRLSGFPDCSLVVSALPGQCWVLCLEPCAVVGSGARWPPPSLDLFPPLLVLLGTDLLCLRMLLFGVRGKWLDELFSGCGLGETQTLA